MPTHRTRISRARQRPAITSEMIVLFRRGREIVAAGDDRLWEDEGGHRREFLELSSQLQQKLGRRPWEGSVFFASTDARTVAARRALAAAAASTAPASG
jgi:hypothetical protein